MSYAYPPPSESSSPKSSPSSWQKTQRSASYPHDGANLLPTSGDESTAVVPSLQSTERSSDSVPDISSSTVPPPTEPPPSPLTEPAAWFSYPLSYAASSISRRISAPPDPRLTGLLQAPGASKPRYPSPGPARSSSMIFSRSRSRQRLGAAAASAQASPSRKASPFQPLPLATLRLTGFRQSTPEKDRILSKALADEIRLLVPPRLQLEAEWRLCYSVEQDGASLATLYGKCENVGDGRARSGFVVVVKDSVGGIFGAFLTDPPRPSSSYYGTGECFLWSATIQTFDMILAHLPPPPSEDTTHMEGRSTTIVSPTKTAFDETAFPNGNASIASRSGNAPLNIEEEDRIRFRAYPYSGVNDYMIYCEHDYISVGGGDGKYGLWLDDRLEQGVSSPSLTFGNEALSEEGEKFDVIGVEVWFVGG